MRGGAAEERNLRKSQGDIFNGFDDNGHQCSGEDGDVYLEPHLLGVAVRAALLHTVVKAESMDMSFGGMKQNLSKCYKCNKKADPFSHLVVSPSLARTLLVRTSSPYLQPIEISFGGAKRVKATCDISLARLLEDIFCG